MSKTFPLWITKASGEIWQRCFGEGEKIRTSSEIAAIIEKHQHSNRHSREENELPPSLAAHATFATVYQDWIQYLKERNRGKRIPPTTIKKHIEQFLKWGPEKSISSIIQSMTRNWAGLFEVKDESRKAGVAFKASTNTIK